MSYKKKVNTIVSNRLVRQKDVYRGLTGQNLDKDTSFKLRIEH